jgi:hypothetical protein
MRTSILMTSLLALVACLTNEVPDSPAYPDISVDAAAELVGADPDVVVLDIRTPAV